MGVMLIITELVEPYSKRSQRINRFICKVLFYGGCTTAEHSYARVFAGSKEGG
jgi:hypothetical protein